MYLEFNSSRTFKISVLHVSNAAMSKYPAMSLKVSYNLLWLLYFTKSSWKYKKKKTNKCWEQVDDMMDRNLEICRCDFK